MGRTKDMHLRQERDRGQGWDRSLFPGNPNALTVEELRDELAKRGLATEGNQRSLRNRFVRALCVAVPVGPPRPAKAPFPDPSGRTLYFEAPDTDAAAACLEVGDGGRTLRYHDADTLTWSTVNAVFPVPPDTRLRWCIYAEQMYNFVVGVAREDVHEERMLGGDDRGWGFFVTLASAHFNDPSGVGRPYGAVGRSGCKVAVIMDTGAGTLSFELDGRPLGVAFDGIFGTVYPCICISGPNVLHVGHEKVLPPPVLKAAPPNPSGVLTITLAAECALAPGDRREGVRFRANAPVAVDTVLTPLAFGLTFDPRSVTIPAQATESAPLALSALPIPITVRVRAAAGGAAAANVVCEGASIRPVVADPPPVAPEAPPDAAETVDAPAAKRPKTD